MTHVIDKNTLILNLKFNYIVVSIEETDDSNYITIDQLMGSLITSPWERLKMYNQEKLEQVVQTKH